MFDRLIGERDVLLMLLESLPVVAVGAVLCDADMMPTKAEPVLHTGNIVAR